jgi:hypothetical protein
MGTEVASFRRDRGTTFVNQIATLRFQLCQHIQPLILAVGIVPQWLKGFGLRSDNAINGPDMAWIYFLVEFVYRTNHC